MTRSLAVRMSQVTRRYHKGGVTVPVLTDLDLQIGSGDFVAIMGPSGSGKTTLLNLIGGLDRVDSGRIEVAGTHLDGLREDALARWRARHIGFVFQFYNLIQSLSVRQNVELPLLLTDLSGRERRDRVQTVLDILGLADRARHRPGELSGGQQQRVGIGRAIIADPPVLLCDEPTGDLDRDMANEILDLLGLLSKEFNKTVLMVTHDPEAAGRAERILRLDKGRFWGGTLQ